VAPQDTWRLNYLDNDDEIEKVNKLSVLLVYKVHILNAQCSLVVLQQFKFVKRSTAQDYSNIETVT